MLPFLINPTPWCHGFNQDVVVGAVLVVDDVLHNPLRGLRHNKLKAHKNNFMCVATDRRSYPAEAWGARRHPIRPCTTPAGVRQGDPRPANQHSRGHALHTTGSQDRRLGVPYSGLRC